MSERYADTIRGLTLPFDGVWPELGADSEIHAGASLLGKVTAGKGLRVGDHGVIRADGHYVRIGDDFHLGVHGTVHIAHDLYPTHIGDRVVAGRNSVIHACTVGSDCVFEDDVVILDGSTVGDGVLIEKGSIVFPRSILESGFVYAGMPAKRVRPIDAAEISERASLLRAAVVSGHSSESRVSSQGGEREFVARTADLGVAVTMAQSTSVFFGCRLIGPGGSITIGENTNIQDNTVIDTGGAQVTIGANTTFGHNVETEACTIGSNALIGIGSRLATGTVVENDVMLAAGSHTLPGQQLESGWLWAGRPSRPISRLTAQRREDMAKIIHHYRNYAQAYRQAQQAM